MFARTDLQAKKQEEAGIQKKKELETFEINRKECSRGKVECRRTRVKSRLPLPHSVSIDKIDFNEGGQEAVDQIDERVPRALNAQQTKQKQKESE
jgi:hypothetical protein